MRTILSLLALLALTACGSLAGGSSQEIYNRPGRGDDRIYNDLVTVGDTVYVAGTIGVDPATGQAPTDPEKEIRLALDGVAAKLALADLTMDDLVSVQIFCSDLSLYDTFNGIWRTYFSAPEHMPVRAFLGSGPILRNGRFEICCIAVRP